MNTLYKLFLLTGIAIQSGYAAHAQQVIRNLGFESCDAKGNLVSWEPGNSRKKYKIQMDSVTVHEGKFSISMESDVDSAATRGFAGGYSILKSPGLDKKRVIRLTGYIKTVDLEDGVAAIGLELHSPEGRIAEMHSHSIGPSPKGTTDWKKYTVELPLISGVQSVSFGFHISGKGKAWFDDFEVLIDGRPLTDSPTLP